MFVRTGLSGYRRGMGDATSSALSAGVGLATAAAGLWMNSLTLSHDAMTATTQIVNGLEPLLKANSLAYLAGPGTCADQAAALAAFDSAWLWLQSPRACGNGAYGSAGNACISDRSRSGRWPWAAYYRDPIANDPRASGCAAQVAANNPNAAEQSALANLANLFSGSSQQTTAGMFDTTSTNSGTSAALALPAGLSNPVMGLPLWVWLAGGVGLFIALK